MYKIGSDDTCRGNNHICKNEVQDLDLRIVGFSNGAATAIEITRKIRKGKFVPIEEGGMGSSLYFDIDVPIKHLVTIDGATVGTFSLFGRLPKVPKNVSQATNYYQHRGGPAIIHELGVLGKETGKTHEAKDPAIGDRIRGNEVRGAKDIRIDARINEKKDYRPGIFFAHERMYAKNINHNFIVRYVADEVLTLLK